MLVLQHLPELSLQSKPAALQQLSGGTQLPPLSEQLPAQLALSVQVFDPQPGTDVHTLPTHVL